MASADFASQTICTRIQTEMYPRFYEKAAVACSAAPFTFMK